MKNPYYPTALGLYFNYLVHGMGVILMSLNMASLETLWQTNAAGVSIVISSLGIGRLSVLLFAGLLSDRFGRRPFIMLGMCCYMAFFFGILHTNNISIAYVFGFLSGMANSVLDAGTYPLSLIHISSGSSENTSLQKPLTIIEMASSSLIPRCRQ